MTHDSHRNNDGSTLQLVCQEKMGKNWEADRAYTLQLVGSGAESGGDLLEATPVTWVRDDNGLD